MFRELRLALLNTSELFEISQNKYVRDSEECLQLIREATEYQSNVFTQPFYIGSLNSVRAEEVIVSFSTCTEDNGEEISTLQSTPFPIKYFGEWDNDLEIGLRPVSVRMEKVNNFLFVHGITQSTNTNYMVRFDANLRKWLNLCPVPQKPLLLPCLGVVGEFIICAGGLHESDESPEEHSMTDKVWKYSIPSNTWIPTTNLPLALALSVSCTVKSSGNLWVIGGKSCKGEPVANTKDRVYEFDSVGNIWMKRPPMLYGKRGSHSVQEIENGIIVVGGLGCFVPDTFAEMFDFETQQWSYVGGVERVPKKFLLRSPDQSLNSFPHFMYKLKDSHIYLWLGMIVYVFDEKTCRLKRSELLKDVDFQAHIDSDFSVILKTRPENQNAT